MIYNGLIKYDKDIKVVGDLAESWDISDDGLIITFRLRRNVKWHDDNPSLPTTVYLLIRK